MKFCTLLLSIFVLTICPVNTIQAESKVPPGPFGFTMGTTLRDIDERGLDLREQAFSGGAWTYYTVLDIESPPIKYDRFRLYTLYFTDVHGLYLITATTPRYLFSPSLGQTVRSKIQKTLNGLISYWKEENSGKVFKNIKRIFVESGEMEAIGMGVACPFVLNVEFDNFDAAEKYMYDKARKRAGYK